MAKRTQGKVGHGPDLKPRRIEPDFRLMAFLEGGNSPKARAKAQAYFRKEWERIERERLYGADHSWIRRLLRRLTIIR